MKKISDFFERFKNLTPPHGALKKAVADAVSDTLRISISPEKVSIHNGVAFLRISSVARHAVQVNRGKILEQVFRELPNSHDLLRDVR